MADLKGILDSYRPDLTVYEALYRHFHAHPELSHQEVETAKVIISRLSKLPSYSVYPGVGGNGVAAVCSNGSGPTILLRADIDGLPVEELTDLPYASHARQVDSDGVEKPVMHACGHDMHISSLLAAAELLHFAREEWSGTLVLVFQPAEERGAGAERMVKDGLYLKVPVPDVVLGAHVMPYRAGTIGTRDGLMASAADSMSITLYGRGGHSSQPNRTIDPVVMACSTVMRLQTVVSREVAPDDRAVVSVGSIRAGDAENIIPDSANIKVNIRTFTPSTRSRVLAAVRRIIDAESTASAAPKSPHFASISRFPFTFNDSSVTAKLTASFEKYFPDGPHHFVRDFPLLSGSEDFPILATSIDRPSCYWIYGGIDPDLWDRKVEEDRVAEDIPINHSAHFAPVIQPTLTVSTDAYALAALTWLAKPKSS